MYIMLCVTYLLLAVSRPYESDNLQEKFRVHKSLPIFYYSSKNREDHCLDSRSANFWREFPESAERVNIMVLSMLSSYKNDLKLSKVSLDISDGIWYWLIPQ